MSDTQDKGAAFEIPGAEGETVRGNVHLPLDDAHGPDGPLPLVLALHGFKGYKDYGFFPYLTQRLADIGVVAVRFNFSHSGIDDDPSTFGRPDLFERDAWSKQLADVQAVVAAAEMVVCNDSAPLHMAVGFDRRLVTVFGPTNPALAGPYRRDDCVVQPEGITASNMKRYRHHHDQHLIARVGVEAVWAKIVQQLGQ